jgi:hypothetical protein
MRLYRCANCKHSSHYHYDGHGKQRELRSTLHRPPCAWPECKCPRYLSQLEPEGERGS